MNFNNPEYLETVREVVQYLGNSERTEAALEAEFPDVDVATLMVLGIRQGWACKTQIEPNIWRANVDMMRLNNQNLKLIGYVGSYVKIPPRITSAQFGPNQEPYTNNPKNFIDFNRCACEYPTEGQYGR
jgi:hypothetical protein